MKIKEVVKYNVVFSIDKDFWVAVDDIIPFASYYNGHSTLCDSEDMAIEYIKDVFEKIKSAHISSPLSGDNVYFDTIFNLSSGKENDFSTYRNDMYADVDYKSYWFDIRTNGGSKFNSLLTMHIIPHHLTMVTD